jgi:hypothetical protein
LTAHDRADPTPTPSAAGLDDLARRAEYHGISPLVHRCAPRLVDLDPRVRDTLEASYHHAVRRHLFILDDLASLHAWLGQLDEPWVVVKGPVLAETIYPRPDLRSYTDIDVVVPRPSFETVLEVLADHGAHPRDPDWRELLAAGRGEIEVCLPSGSIVDLHWALINMPHVRRRFPVDHAMVLARTRTVDIEGRRYRTLGEHDTIVHLALHAVLSGGDRLVWVEDLHQATNVPDLDWVGLADAARSWGALPALSAQLARRQRLLGVAPPADVRRVLSPSRAWSVACALGDRVAPPEASVGAMSVAKRLSQASAPTSAGVLVALGRSVSRGVRRGVRRRGGGRGTGAATTTSGEP